MYRSTDRLGTRQRYDDLLAPAGQSSTKSIPRRVHLARLAAAVGRRQAAFFKRLAQARRPRTRFSHAQRAVWTAWASLGPASLRAFLRSLLLSETITPASILRDDDPCALARIIADIRGPRPPQPRPNDRNANSAALRRPVSDGVFPATAPGEIGSAAAGRRTSAPSAASSSAGCPWQTRHIAWPCRAIVRPTDRRIR